MEDSQALALFCELKSLLAPYSSSLETTIDAATEYSLNTRHVMKNKKSLFFAAVKINKQYVSFHLMPVYVFPDLLTSLDPSLKQRMHGKSCFNFTGISPEQLSVLKALVDTSFRRFVQENYINQG